MEEQLLSYSPWVMYPFFIFMNVLLYNFIKKISKSNWDAEPAVMTMLLLGAAIIFSAIGGFLYGGIVPGVLLAILMPTYLFYGKQSEKVIEAIKAWRASGVDVQRIEKILGRIRRQVEGESVWSDILARADRFKSHIPDFHSQISELETSIDSLDASMEELNIKKRHGGKDLVKQIRDRREKMNDRLEEMKGKLFEIELFVCLLQAETATRTSDDTIALLEEKSKALMCEIEQDVQAANGAEKEVSSPVLDKKRAGGVQGSRVAS